MKSKKWPALLRGSVLSSTMSKNISYVGLADKRAHTLITINTFMVPLALSRVADPVFRLSAVIVALTAGASILCAVLSLLPKKYDRKGHYRDELLHFSGMKHFTEKQYVKEMGKSLNDKERIGQLMALDIYHMSTSILVPKFKWLRYSYFTFLTGYGIAVFVTLAQFLL